MVFLTISRRKCSSISPRRVRSMLKSVRTRTRASEKLAFSMERSSIRFAKSLGAHSQDPDHDSDQGSDRRENPGAHDDFRLRPAFGFEMMMERRGQEDFAFEEAFREKLDRRASGLEHVDENDDEEHDDRIREHGHYPEGRSERYGAGIAHEEACRIDIEPEKSEERAGKRRTESREIHAVLCECDKRERAERREEHSRIQAVQAVGFVR